MYKVRVVADDDAAEIVPIAWRRRSGNADDDFAMVE